MNIHGHVSIENEILETRDAIGVSETEGFLIKANEDSEILLIEVPMI